MVTRLYDSARLHRLHLLHIRPQTPGVLKSRQTLGRIDLCGGYMPSQREQVIIHYMDTSFIDQYSCNLLVTGSTPTVTPSSYVLPSYSEISVFS